MNNTEKTVAPEAALLPQLRARGKSLATAESCTGGDLARRFTELPGASAVFLGGVVSYASSVKVAVLGVEASLIEQHGAVSRPVAAAMAKQAREITGADYALSTTGLAGPDGDGVHEVGTVFVGLASPEGVRVRELRLGADKSRSEIRRLAGDAAFSLLLALLAGELPLAPLCEA